MTRMYTTLTLTLALAVSLLSLSAAARAAPPSPAPPSPAPPSPAPLLPDPAAAFADANSAFDAAARSIASDPIAARSHLNRAVALYSALIADDRAASAPLNFNLATALLLSGDNGRAVLHFLRAQRLSPQDSRIAANLHEARNRIRADVPAPPPPDPTRAERAVAHIASLPLTVYAAILAASSALFWLSLALRLTPFRPSRWLPAALALPALLSAAALAAHHASTNPWGQRLNLPIRGVITSPDTTGLTGPLKPIAQPSFPDPLPAGVEFILVTTSDDSAHIRLGDGRETWVPLASIALVAHPLPDR